MPRVRLLCALAAALLVCGCAAAAGTPHTIPPTTPAAATAAVTPSPGTIYTSRVDRPPRASVQPPAAVARAFADAYIRYLDGRLPATALPSASVAARAQVGPAIAPGDRAGHLVVQFVRRTAVTPRFTIHLRDRAHMFPAQLTLGATAAGWRVIAVSAPDLDSILHTQSNPIQQPSGSALAERAARSFITGYLPWLYGEGSVDTIHDATGGLIDQLKAHPPRIPPTFQGLRPRLASIGMQRHGDRWRAYALVTDGRVTFDLVVTVEQPNGRWLVSSVGLSG